MKRLGSSDSLGAPISIFPASEERNSSASSIYNRGFPSVMDGLYEEDYSEECGQITEKKRRLTAEQVKALEKDFELENKLEPERKVKLAQELGLQPRQVAVWFQNRRARWKTKQLERDYAALKSNYEALKTSFDVLRHDKEALLAELTELKSKHQQEVPKMEGSMKEETPETIFSEQNPILENKSQENQNLQIGISMFNDFKDGSSDSDSSAILNEDHSPNAIQEPHDLFMMSSSLRFSCSTSMEAQASEDSQKSPLLSFMRIDEHDFLSSDEPCDFFNEEQAPTLPWLSPGPWN